MTIHELQRRLKGFDILTEVHEAIFETAENIADFNRKQLFEGIRSTGSEIKPAYAPLTILIKDQKGQPTDRVTLKDTDEFYESIGVNAESDTYEISASDEKAESLEKKYGKRILGLTKDSRSEYVAYHFFPALRERITKRLGFKFG